MIDEIPMRDSLPKKRFASFSPRHLATLLGLIFTTVLVLLLCSKGLDLVASKIWPQPGPTLVVSKVEPAFDKQEPTIGIPNSTPLTPPPTGRELQVVTSTASTESAPVSLQLTEVTPSQPAQSALPCVSMATEDTAGTSKEMSDIASLPDQSNLPPISKEKIGKNLLQEKKVQHQIQHSNSNHYTVQIIAMYDRKRLCKFIDKNHLNKQVKIYQSELQGKPWYVAVCGDFKSHEEALKAISCLPAEVKEQKPWVRSVASLQRLPHVAE